VLFAVISASRNCSADLHYSVLCFTGQKLEDDNQNGIPEVFIDQDEVLAKVCIVI